MGEAMDPLDAHRAAPPGFQAVGGPVSSRGGAAGGAVSSRGSVGMSCIESGAKVDMSCIESGAKVDMSCTESGAKADMSSTFPGVVPSVSGARPGARTEAPSAGQIDAFAHDLYDREAAAAATAWAYLEGLGSADRLYEALFVPAAIRLGEWWESDEVCFATVTLGMATLQRLLWSVRPPGLQPNVSGTETRLLLAPVPGQQHTFGLNLLCEQLRARGGRPMLLACPTRHELITAVKFGAFQVVGLSVACDEQLHGLPELAQAVREASPKPVHMLLGGPLAGRLSALADRYGVDEVVVERPVERLCSLLFEAPQDRAGSSAVAA